MNTIIKEKLNKMLALLAIILAFAITIMIMFKYKTEGETNLPFMLTKIMIVSSAETETKQDNPNNYKWNININQYNDIYMEIRKNYEYKNDAYIKSVSIENLQISTPKVGTEEAYMPNSAEGKQFVYDENFKIANSLTYTGASGNNPKNLEIANQGGNLVFRIVNRNTSEYVSNEDGELAYDGTLLKKTNVNVEDVKINVSFDVVIVTNTMTYRGNVSFEIPPDDLEEKGVSNITITDFSNVTFKREKI